jgi:dUTP pyrophosphatase
MSRPVDELNEAKGKNELLQHTVLKDYNLSHKFSENISTVKRSANIPTKAARINNWLNFLCFEKTHENAQIPSRSSEKAAGYDLYSAVNLQIPAWESRIINTHIKMSMPRGLYGRIASRSGLAAKNNIEVGAGVIDPDYQGEIMVVLRNFSEFPYEVHINDRIAQLILENYSIYEVKQVASIAEIRGVSQRGEKGFGSSGK